MQTRFYNDPNFLWNRIVIDTNSWIIKQSTPLNYKFYKVFYLQYLLIEVYAC